MAGICDPVAVAAASIDGVCVATAGRAILHVCVRLPMVPGEHNASQVIARTARAERNSREKITSSLRQKSAGPSNCPVIEASYLLVTNCNREVHARQTHDSLT